MEVNRYQYTSGVVSVWFDDRREAVQCWRANRRRLVEPCIAEPIQTSPSLWRVDYQAARQKAGRKQRA